jgi:hypothetical protein
MKQLAKWPTDLMAWHQTNPSLNNKKLKNLKQKSFKIGKLKKATKTKHESALKN